MQDSLMDIITSVIDIVKDVGPEVKKYVKYQMRHNDYVSEFKEMQENLKHRRNVIDANLKTQQKQPGKIPNGEVEAWLKKADQETAESVVEDMICKGGCFTYICSSRKFDKKTQALNGIFMQGENYANAGQSLVLDDHSIEYCTKVFKEMQEQLKLRQEDIEAKLKTQCMPGKIARQEVRDWMEKASQQIAIKVEDLISPGERSSSSNLEKKTEELKQTFEQGEKYTNAGESLVVDDHSIKGVPLVVDECSGKDDVQDRILEWLKGDEVIRIAVSGMGGVGKTTIMKQVHNQLLKEPKFNKAIWVKVSRDFDIFVQQKREFDVRRFQKRIASSLELKLEPEDYENETKNAGMISQKLRQGSFVLILDDMWHPFSLEDVGIPNLVGNNGCKLVLTTRLQDVARAMECKVILVNPLPPEEALALFLKKVGSEVLSDGRIKVDIKPFLEQILQKCGGVPLAIVTVAKSMRGKLLPRNWNYECLEPQCQECFLYCALYPEDAKIAKEELIEYWIEEGLIYKEGKTREAMNLKGHGILDKLVDNCLLELVGDNEDCVSMHDLLREMALEISQFFVKAGIGLEKLPEEDEWREYLLKVSLMDNHITEIPSSMPPPKCPMLTTLLLSNNMIITIPEAFFEHMLGLKILDLSRNLKLSRLPTSVSKLEKLTTLLLQNCRSLREVPSLSNLVGLKKLDLSWTSIEELPQGLNMLTNLKYLGLGGRLPETLDELLQNLSKLQHLMVNTETKFKWEKIGSWRKLQNLEKLVLRNLDTLNAVFGEVGVVAESASLPAGTFSSARWLGYLQKLQTIEVINCEQLEEIIGSESEGGEKVTLPKLERLKLTLLPQLKTICSGSLICDSIKKIEICLCKNIESVFWSGFNPLPNLESLYLSHLENLKSVFDEEGLGLSSLVPPTSFFSLKEISVNGCGQLKKVFSSGWLLRYFQSLETIDVRFCFQMEELISSSAHEEEKVTLPKLQSLQLMGLWELKSIYSSSLICDSIKQITISNGGKIESIFGQEGLGLSPLVPPTSFFSPKEISINDCAQLKKVLSSGWLLRYFQSLETLYVQRCPQMEELIPSSTDEEEKVTLPKLQCLHLTGFNPLPNLEYLELGYLKNLKCVFDEEGLGLSPLVPPTSFFSLKEIRVTNCDQLKKVFSSGWLLCYFQSLETIDVYWCFQMEELVSSSKHEEEKVTLPNLQSLQLQHLLQLKSICSSSSVLICDSIQSLRILGCQKLKRIPLNFPLLDNAQSSHPPSLKKIRQLGFGSTTTRKLEENTYALVAVAIGFSI
ncbi:hypothetical protein SLEP1_g57847 [Rubroshorea leprosula]|uniref:NB-ARC domain-containing protein n=1 Tax=Rubroshorea leprosula TaxID=152421 RepID=A0AAV5MR16_9ROSI|nr:hypothetical protein SLEP1_g57847 [Rubroshorea leprosula]